MKFAYTYRSSDGQRHAAEIEAESRDAAFARLRTEFGIRPIRVELKTENEELKIGDGKADGDDKGFKGVKGFKGTIGLILAAALLAALGIWLWLAARRVGDNVPYQVMTPQGPVTYSVAQPLPRQMIPGDRGRIENGKLRIEGDDGTGGGTGVFRFAAEAYLALFAEPGRPMEVNGDGDVRLPSQSSRPSQMSQEARVADFKACLKEPIRIASNDFTEIVDLKRIVTGMKLEMRAYLAAGGTVAQYLAELAKRQKLEVSYRENAERKLNEMLAATGSQTSQTPQTPQTSQTPQTPNSYQAAYAYWLKANAQLQSMGIYPLPLPDALRMYQMGLELEN